MVGRAFYTAASLTSFFIALIAAVLWIRSFWICDELFVYSRGRETTIFSADQTVLLCTRPIFSVMPSTVHYFRPPSGSSESLSGSDVLDRWEDVVSGRGNTSLPVDFCLRGGIVGLYAKDWALATIGLPLPISLTMLRVLVARRRTRQGRCRKCGYDMRATPERCPECGNLAKSPVS